MQNELIEKLKETQTNLVLCDETLFNIVRWLLAEKKFRIQAFQSKESSPESVFDEKQDQDPVQNVSVVLQQSKAQINVLLTYFSNYNPNQLNRININIIFIPKLNTNLQQLISDKLNKVQFYSVNIPFFFQETDFLTLNDLKDSNNAMLLSLKLLFQKTGIPNEILYKGEKSSELATQLYEQLYCEVCIENSENYSPNLTYHKVILLDRECDPISALLRPVSYFGVLKEIFQSIDSTFYQSPTGSYATKVVQQAFPLRDLEKQSNCTTIQLREQQGYTNVDLHCASDPVFSKISNIQISNVPKELEKIGNQMQEFYSHKNTLKTMNISQVKDIGGQVKFYRLLEDKLKLHTRLFQQLLVHTNSDFYQYFDIEQMLITNFKKCDQEKIKDYIVTQISLIKPLQDILRISCLYSLIRGGLDNKFYNKLCTLIIQFYGFQYYPTLKYLSNKQWLLPENKQLKKFQQGCNFFGSQNPSKDCCFYSLEPLSVRLLELICYSDQFTKMTNAGQEDDETKIYLQSMMQSNVDEITVPAACETLMGGAADTYLLKEINTQNQQGKTILKSETQNVLVVYMGGVSPAELTAIRQLNNSKTGEGSSFGDFFQVTVLSNCMITGDQLIADMFDNQTSTSRYIVNEDGQQEIISIQEAVLCKQPLTLPNIEQCKIDEEEEEIGQQAKKKRIRRV